MIIDLNENLYVIDERTHEHKVKFIDTINKIVYVDKEEDMSGSGYDFVGTITVTGRTTATNHNDYLQVDVAGFYYGTHPITVTIKST